MARRIGIALSSFVVAWLAVSLLALWLFGSGNILVWVIAAVFAVAVSFEVRRRDRRVA